MKKLVLSILLLLPLISNGQKVMVWRTETATTLVMIDIQSGPSPQDQVFQLIYDDKSTNEIDKYSFGIYVKLPNGKYLCTVKDTNDETLVNRKFILTPTKDYYINGVRTKWIGYYKMP
jgi:hypothetical protein